MKTAQTHENMGITVRSKTLRQGAWNHCALENAAPAHLVSLCARKRCAGELGITVRSKTLRQRTRKHCALENAAPARSE